MFLYIFFVYIEMVNKYQKDKKDSEKKHAKDVWLL